MSQFIDEVEIEVTSGDGGNGLVAWRREKYEPLGGPAGGDGGRGGDIYLQATGDINTLLDFRFKAKFQADPGQKGGSKNKFGKSATDLTIRVPIGTSILDMETGYPVADLVADGQRVLVAKGGRGGRGNASLATQRMKAPHYCEPGEAGIRRFLRLELKVLADVGIVGLPNAGKSTLLSALTRARPKIADYPFTTLVPNLGVVKMPSSDGFVMADVPGLIEGASEGVGLGHRFLKHLERTSLLVHLVDASSLDIAGDIGTIDRELERYGDHIAKLPQLLVANKIDLLDEDERGELQATLAGLTGGREILLLSAATTEGAQELVNLLSQRLSEVKPPRAEVEEVTELEPDPGATTRADDGFEILRKRNVFTVVGGRVERLISVTHLKDPESLTHMYRVLRAMGVIDALLQEGIEPGMDVIIAGVVFSYGEDWG